MVRVITPLSGFDRRSFLSRAAPVVLSAGAVALLAGRESLAQGYKTDATNDVGILNALLAAEHQAIAAYQVGADSGLLQKAVRDIAIKFQTQHKAHADLLGSSITKLGGKPVQTKPSAAYNFPTDKLKNQADVLQFAAGLEKGAAGGYLGVIPVFTSRDLAKAAASILGDEAMHYAVLRNALGQDPVPDAFVS